MLDTTKPISDIWREVRSADPGVEIAHILSVAKVMAQSLVPKVDVSMSGIKYAHTDGQHNIFVTAEDLDEFPIPGSRVDVLLGDTIHEAGHILFSPDKAKLVGGMAKKLHVCHMEQFATLINIMEDSYINFRIQLFPIYKEYINKAFQDCLSRIDMVKIITPLTTDTPLMGEILNGFILADISGKLPAGMSSISYDAISQLVEITEKMSLEKLSREKAITDAWNVIKGFSISRAAPEKIKAKQEPSTHTTSPDEEPTNDQQGGMIPPISDNTPKVDEQPPPIEGELPTESSTGNESEGKTESKDEDDDGEEDKSKDKDDDVIELPITPISLSKLINDHIQNKESLPDGIAEDVADAIISNREDISSMAKLLCGDSSETIVSFTPKNMCAIEEIRNTTSPIEEKLRRIFQQYRDKRTEYTRGLYSGKVSNRRLHRAGYGDERVFQRKDRPEEINATFGLLMDCSSSMAPNYDLIYQIVVALSDTMAKEKVKFFSMGYSKSGNVFIANFASDSNIHIANKNLWGTTPSYQALGVAIATLLKEQRTKRRILIHFTDGEPDVKTHIPNLLRKARENGVADYHVGSCYKSNIYENKAGDNTIGCSDLNKLPGIVEQILRKEIK